MSITFGTTAQFANAASAQTSTVVTSTNLTITTGDTVIVACRGTTAGLAIATVTDTLGNTYQLRNSAGHGGGGQGIAIFDCVNAIGGSSAITGTATSAMVAIWAVPVTGLTASPFQTAAGAEIQGGGTAGTDNYTASSVVATAPSVVFCFLHDINAEGTTNGAPVAGTGWTGLGATWQVLGSAGANATALPVYKEASGTVAALFSLTATNKNDFFWNETAAYAEAGNPVSIAWTV